MKIDSALNLSIALSSYVNAKELVLIYYLCEFENLAYA